MSKYQFHRMGGETFEQMVQALLEKRRRGFGTLIQFGVGADGSREATWTQPTDHPDYSRPNTTDKTIPKKWVFQVKFHDLGQRGWRVASEALINDLKTELEKLTVKNDVACDHYVLITNVPLSGVRWIGTRDQITKVAEDWKTKIPNVEVWDAVDLSRMLDNNRDVRTAYMELILPGDILAAIYHRVQFQAERRENTFRGYLKYLVDNESKARADEAGDEDQLPLVKIFVDQALRLDREKIPEQSAKHIAAWSLNPLADTPVKPIVPGDLDEVPSSFVLLLGAHDKVMLLAGPGYGKSTITQFLALYHASRLVNPEYAVRLANKLKLPPSISAESLDSFCALRFPFRVELRRYATWRKTLTADYPRAGLATYIARELIGKNVESHLTEDDIFELANRNPVLLILDGLDEVPNKESRDELLKDCDAFIYRCSGEEADIQIIMSSRPQGYNGEFDRFEPVRWRINDLSETDFNEYCRAWLAERMKNADERNDAEERIRRGMQSNAVKRLATTLLQATVMLTIVRRKSDIPEERHKLYEKYVEVVFQREKSKSELISRYEPELRRLHEIVGYRLHEAIGRGDDGKIPEARFREYVREVWHLLRGDQPFTGIPNHECQNIVQLATDRLVFLSGKGEEQTDIDFVIQPYREYFAAQYMNLHTEALPDKVFECLVERGPFWQNVLQFYVALAQPAQQIAWVQRAAEKASKSLCLEDLIKGVEYQRATLATLPEYVRFSLLQFRRAISVALPEQAWWMWSGQEWAIPIISSLKSGECWRELLKQFQQAGLEDDDKVAFALWMFPRGIPKDAPEREVLASVIRILIDSKKHARTAVHATLLYDLPVDLKQTDPDVISSACEGHELRRPLRGVIKPVDLLSKLSRTVICRLLCFESMHMPDMLGTDIWGYLDLPVKVPREDAEDCGPDNDVSVSVGPPHWTKYTISEQPPLPFQAKPSEVSDAVENYIYALFDALQHPANRERHLTARLKESKLPSPVAWSLSSDAVLGPAPEHFSSEDNWAKFKVAIQEYFGNEDSVAELRSVCMTMLEASTNDDHVWTALLFHPNDWGRLRQEGMISLDALLRLQKSKWAAIMNLPIRLVDAAECNVTYAYYQANRVPLRLPLVKLLGIAFRVHEDGGLRDSSFLFELLTEADFSYTESEEVNTLLNGIRNVAEFPEIWGLLLMEVSISTPGIDKQLVTRLWSELNRFTRRRIWFLNRSGPRAQLARDWIKDLVDIGDSASLDLALAINSPGRELVDEVSASLNKKLALELCKAGEATADHIVLASGLFRSRATIDEASLYANAVWFNSARLVMPRFIERVAERIQIMPQAIPRSDYERLSAHLKLLLDREKGYPAEIAAAALNALIQIDVITREPISEKLWQISPEKTA